MFAVRTLTAAALIAGFLAAVLLLERAVFAVLIGAVLGWAAWEWAALSGLRGWRAAAYSVACTFLYAIVAWSSWPPSVRGAQVLGTLVVAAAFWLLLAPILLWRGTARQIDLPFSGVLVLVPTGLTAAGLPAALLLSVLGLVWVSDTAAYLVGRKFGRHKLAPKISPGKTVEGAAGAIAASIAYAVILAFLMPDLGPPLQGLAWACYLAGAALICVSGMLGDLFESWAKRQAGVKDSGRVLPGHGGVLDRIDSACAALPFGALLVAWWGAG